ncbi:MAG: histidine--tRNA ligase [Candidatus Aureabacteria bacterium]|nr:histidine--tRNA ligase [Candidatus Auribacterota bacterium]
MLQNVRGTEDVLPGASQQWLWLEEKARSWLKRFNFEEIRTPIFELTELFIRSIGETTDIVNKEMYTFSDRKGRSLTLRPEGTASVVRACLQHKLIQPNQVLKLYYIGPMFRYERPQAGRQRQFHQIGIEILGCERPAADLESILLLKSLFQEWGISRVGFRINSTGSRGSRPLVQKRLREWLSPHIQDLCADCRNRYEKNVFRVYDCKEKSCKSIIGTLPGILEILSEEDRKYFDDVRKGLDQMGVEYELDPHLVRGLDYYTHTIFEAYSDQLGSCDAIAGGGRYDGLFQEMGSAVQVPAVGWGIGMERILNVLQSLSLLPSVSGPDIVVIASGDENTSQNIPVVQELRQAGFKVEYDLLGRNMKAQFRLADRTGARLAVIRGENEIQGRKVKIKDLTSHEEIELDEDKLLLKVKEILSAAKKVSS